MEESIERLRAELERERARSARLEQVAVTDVLTGLYNRRYGLDALSRLEATRVDARQAWAGRHTRLAPYALLMVDVDLFKRVNDTYGHPVGDQVLVALAETMQTTCRASDVLVRWGGEEFLIICHNTSPENALALAQRLCTNIESDHIGSAFGLPWNMTASVGVSQPGNYEESYEVVIRRADDALYRAKDQGRNRAIQLFAA